LRLNQFVNFWLGSTPASRTKNLGSETGRGFLFFTRELVPQWFDGLLLLSFSIFIIQYLSKKCKAYHAKKREITRKIT